MSPPLARPSSVAVVGGGIAGITAAHALSRVHRTTLFEASASIGGHAHALPVDDGRGGTVDVDTAFLVFNELHYPSFCQLLDAWGVSDETRAVKMTASFVDDARDLRFVLGDGLDALFCQRANLRRPRLVQLLFELVRFRRRAYRDMTQGHISPTVTIGTYLAPFSRDLRELVMVPMASAIWSLPGSLVASYPARALLQFFMNHRLLRGRTSNAWRTFHGSSATYVRAFERGFVGEIRKRAPVLRVFRTSHGVEVAHPAGRERFDAVVLATHADDALAMLDVPSTIERRVLGAFRYHPTRVRLHGDRDVLHHDRRTWACWNMVSRAGQTLVTYHLNRVQGLASGTPDWFVTLGDEAPSRRDRIADFVYRHPIFDTAAIEAQNLLASIQGGQRTYFCGSYGGHGFHEDAVVSALRATHELRVNRIASTREVSHDGAAQLR